MSGEILRAAIEVKWGKPYDVQLRRVNGRVILLVMWKFWGQASFPLSEQDYVAHLDTLVMHLQDWGVWERVLQEIQETRQRPRQGKAVTIPLPLGDRAAEWLL
ncbi:MAG: DUF3067 family protein [Synechococcales cyanobacterium]